MAVRPQHMHDGGIMERRLRPIYDWLDNGNNKKALQEAEKVLKKSPSLQAARALKALALFRLGKAPEAHAVLDALADEKPSDDTTLQAMTITYRESQQLHKVCALYEAAVKAEPTSEELHSHLFMSYVRIGDYRAQQRAAMALYKFTPKNPYYFWAVMSIVLQAKTTDDSKQKGILLTLAQRMVDNFITENKMEAEQEARLYIMILELQEKWEDILKFIEGPLYSRLVPGSTAQACIPYLKKLNQWRRMNVICKELLWENQDRWDYYLPYFESVFELMEEGPSEEGFDNTPEKCHEFICQIVESVSPGRTLRGPYLARLELYKRLSGNGDPSALLGSVIGLLLEYLRVFAHKPCAVPDLRPYFPMVPQKEREEHSRDFLTCLGFDENSEPDNMDDIQRHISCLGAWRLTAAPMAGEESLALADTLRRHYLRCLNKGLVTSTLTEFCAVDGYSILAAHQYFYAAVQLKSAAPVVEALGLLELVLHHSPSNFHAKLLLVTLYHLIGNAMAADSIYQRLEVKHIQLVSLGWLHAARLQPACAPARALQLLADTRAFHSHHAKDSVEHLTYAYKYGTFEKLVELVGWSRRLFQCAFAAACARERALAALLAGPPPAANVPLPPPPPHPTDNRDIDVILNWDPPQLQDPNLKTRTFERELMYLRLKDCLVSAIALCIECSTRPPDQRKKHYDELKVCLDLWRFAFDSSLEKYKDCVGEKDITCISAPFPSRIIAFVNSPVPYRDMYSSVFGLAGELCAGHAASAHLFTERAARLVAQGAAAVAGAVGGGGDLWALREHLETLANFLEFLGVVTFALGVCHELVAPANAKKPKKKPNHSPDELKTNQLLNKLNETVQTSIATVEGLFSNLPKYNITCSLEEEFAKLNMRNHYHSPVEQKLKQGQADMIIDIKNILKKKTKYLKTLLH